MPLPGLSGAGHAGLVAVISASSNTPVDLSALLGVDSSAPVVYSLFVSSGVTQGSTSVSTPAIDATGLHADSIGYWFVDGTVVGKGGNGAYVPAGGFPFSLSPGGGGGGAGAAVGVGGAGFAPGTNGSNGTSTTGGAAGVNDPTPTAAAGATIDAEDGGDAVHLSHTAVVIVSGGVRGGGGGGGYNSSGFIPQAAGNLDSDGSGNIHFGVKGYAVRLSGTGAWSASGGGTVGTVG